MIKNEDNFETKTSGGNDTKDKVFLLSQKEAETLFSNKKERIAKATGYTQKTGVYVNERTNALWWLRSPGNGSDAAGTVHWNGWINSDGYDVSYDSDGVRPALYLKF